MAARKTEKASSVRVVDRVEIILETSWDEDFLDLSDLEAFCAAIRNRVGTANVQIEVCDEGFVYKENR